MNKYKTYSVIHNEYCTQSFFVFRDKLGTLHVSDYTKYIPLATFARILRSGLRDGKVICHSLVEKRKAERDRKFIARFLSYGINAESVEQLELIARGILSDRAVSKEVKDALYSDLYTKRMK